MGWSMITLLFHEYLGINEVASIVTSENCSPIFVSVSAFTRFATKNMDLPKVNLAFLYTFERFFYPLFVFSIFSFIYSKCSLYLFFFFWYSARAVAPCSLMCYKVIRVKCSCSRNLSSYFLYFVQFYSKHEWWVITWKNYISSSQWIIAK